ncbi:hypothetical protein Tsubulata_038942 [Turnera subulata]|uniref:Secreted protein n=1 Tax=Turnera subulata TaxID=218843 RepID=A0A9Q0FQV1_9ROSI|nr:hypothetical protein Tsubulata_038942 [Turnera subulata]
MVAVASILIPAAAASASAICPPSRLSQLMALAIWSLVVRGRREVTKVDSYLGISNDVQACVEPQADVREYASATDNQVASSALFELQSKILESHMIMIGHLGFVPIYCN